MKPNQAHEAFDKWWSENPWTSVRIKAAAKEAWLAAWIARKPKALAPSVVVRDEIDCRCMCEKCESRTRETYRMSVWCTCGWEGTALLRKGDKPPILKDCPNCGCPSLIFRALQPSIVGREEKSEVTRRTLEDLWNNGRAYGQDEMDPGSLVCRDDTAEDKNVRMTADVDETIAALQLRAPEKAAVPVVPSVEEIAEMLHDTQMAPFPMPSILTFDGLSDIARSEFIERATAIHALLTEWMETGQSGEWDALTKKEMWDEIQAIRKAIDDDGTSGAPHVLVKSIIQERNELRSDVDKLLAAPHPDNAVREAVQTLKDKCEAMITAARESNDPEDWCNALLEVEGALAAPGEGE